MTFLIFAYSLKTVALEISSSAINKIMLLDLERFVNGCRRRSLRSCRVCCFFTEIVFLLDDGVFDGIIRNINEVC